MMWYKVTRLDGSSFRDPTVTYEVGKRVRPKPYSGKRELCGEGTLHASRSAPEAMRYGKWPCRLFEVEGTPFVTDTDKAGFGQLRVVRELDAWRVFGPNGRHVVAVLDRFKVCTPDEISRLRSSWDAARTATRDAAWVATRETARETAWVATRDAVWVATWETVRGAVRDAAWETAWETAWGAVIADLVGQHGYTQTHHDLLTGPWRKVVGTWNGTEWEKER